MRAVEFQNACGRGQNANSSHEKFKWNLVAPNLLQWDHGFIGVQARVRCGWRWNSDSSSYQSS